MTFLHLVEDALAIVSTRLEITVIIGELLM